MYLIASCMYLCIVYVYIDRVRREHFDLEHSFADRWQTFDEQRGAFVVIIGKNVVVAAAVCKFCTFGCVAFAQFLLLRQLSLDVRHTIQKTVLWCSIGNNTAKKTGSTAPWEDPAIEFKRQKNKTK